MASTQPGHVALNGREYVLQDETYRQQLQTPFNPRFATGDPGLGDLSFFQYIDMKDWSGGNGQEVFDVTNRFWESEGIDVTKSGEIKLTPRVDFVRKVNGPQHEHLSQPVEDEDAWPQIIEWLGRLVIFNDRTEFDAGGTEFLEVFETEIIGNKVLGNDISGTGGVITDDTAHSVTKTQIVSISKVQGLPDDVVQVLVRFTKPQLELLSNFQLQSSRDPDLPRGSSATIRFRLDFGGDAEYQSKFFTYQDITYDFAAGQLEFVSTSTITSPYILANLYRLNRTVEVTFTIKVPAIPPGIYKLWTSVAWKGHPFANPPNKDIASLQLKDPNTNANVLFFVQSVDQVLVTRKNLYAPQLKAAAVSGSKLVGGRKIDSVGYIEVYQKQNGSVDRTLQLSLSAAGVTPVNPTYMELISNNGIIVAAFDNRIYKIDIETVGLSVPARFTFIGQVPGSYVSGMALWNQRVYGVSFDKSLFKSTIWWTDLLSIQGTYDIDGKFWATEMANFQGALFYAGGDQDGKGQVRAFPSVPIISVEHPIFDSRVRALNAGRLLYAGWSHGTGLLAINEAGASTWARDDMGDSELNVVWGVEEVGYNVYFMAKNGLFKTTDKFIDYGWLETSQFGGNTALIKKLWASVTIEAQAMTGAHTIRVLAQHAEMEESQWAILGTMVESDGRQKEFQFPDDFNAQWMRVRLEINTTDPNTTPVIKKLLVKYVPDSIPKWQWVFTVRATDNLKLLNGVLETRLGADILDDMRDLKAAGFVTFRDIDETSYRVVVTDIQIFPPLVDKGRPEALVSVELLET